MANKTKLEILVIEDEHLGIAKSYFGSVKDIDVDFTETKAEALSKLAEKKYDGLITDEHFPENKGEKAANKGNDIAYVAMTKGMPWIKYSSHGPSAILTFPLRKIDAAKAKKARDYFDWLRKCNNIDDLGSIDDAQNIVYAYGGTCHGNPKEIQKNVGVIESYLPKHQKTCKEGWENAFSILKNVIDMYTKGSDLADYFLEKAKETGGQK
ncbi:MAG: hypothetical protein QW041_02520 [Candidatus Pacearchaeota archaeon]